MGDKMKKKCESKEKDSFAMRHDQKIECDVTSCKHLDDDTGCCDLPDIKVSCNCDPEKVKEKHETICDSFECKCSDQCDKEKDHE